MRRFWPGIAFAVALERGSQPASRSHLLVEDAGRVVIVGGAAEVSGSAE